MSDYAQQGGRINFDADGQLKLAATFSAVAEHLNSEAEKLRRIAFAADDRTALRLLGYSGAIEFKQDLRIVAPQ